MATTQPPTNRNASAWSVHHLGKKVRAGSSEPKPVLEQFIYAICREAVTPELAEQAYQQPARALLRLERDPRQLRARDWPRLCPGWPTPRRGPSASSISCRKCSKPPFPSTWNRCRRRASSRPPSSWPAITAANDYATAWVVQQSLGGHAIPLDDPSLRSPAPPGPARRRERPTWKRCGPASSIRSPRRRGQLFVDVVSVLANGWCHEDEPACPSCPMAAHCPTGQDMQPAPVAAVRPKPR